MFVLKSTHDKVLKDYDNAIKVLKELIDDYTYLSRDYNLLRTEYEEANSKQFTEAEIKTLISLCHPDKHNGKESATCITKKLLSLRGK